MKLKRTSKQQLGKRLFANKQTPGDQRADLAQIVKESWQVIAPSWPLKNLIAVNPLQGFEDLPIEKALVKGAAYFQQTEIPKPMEAVNREMIKWLQAYFDEGQAAIPMPQRTKGLYKAWRELALYDPRLHQNQKIKIDWIKSLPHCPKKALSQCLLLLDIPQMETRQFLELLLASLPGWASYVKYRTDWNGDEQEHHHPVTQIEFLAVRTTIVCLLWPEAKKLLSWHQKGLQQHENHLDKVKKFENNYRIPLLKKLSLNQHEKRAPSSAQFVFCIDTRSEPFRRAIEMTGSYETFGIAGFFGVPVRITNTETGESYNSCPILLSPKCEVKESPCDSYRELNFKQSGHERLSMIRRLYQSLKYTFLTPFALAEGLGLACAAWIGLRTLAPSLAHTLKDKITNLIRKPHPTVLNINDIKIEEQCSYAEGALKMMGLTNDFAPFVIFCGHGSKTENNAYGTSLDCGACGGRHGTANARILAKILNRAEVRKYLKHVNINIPANTRFLAAFHNTTTDEVTLYDTPLSEELAELKKDLKKAQHLNNNTRIQKFVQISKPYSVQQGIIQRSKDWAQVRPEWGLARNAAFIIAPRNLTRSLDLEGRCFLHSYDPSKDEHGKLLESILTAPMVVAQWINAQYLFSTLDNVSFGGGSKVTKNVTGKIGIMQGNASDLMTGLPLQSVYSADHDPYHEPQRLLTIAYAPCSRLHSIIEAQPILQKLFGNGWVQLACIEPESRKIYFLERDLSWQEII